MMKRISAVLISVICAVALLVPASAFAQDEAPQLVSISFKNAKIDGKFDPDVLEYGLILDNNESSPTLESYSINGNADIFVTYTYDETNHQTGLTVTLEYEWGSTIYNFSYKNDQKYSKNSNNLLTAIYCTYGELSPALNDEETEYKLYIPSDITELTITPVTSDIQAFCAPVELTLNNKQAPKITLTCTASDGSEREYHLTLKRVDKTTSQVKAEMAQPGYTSFVDGTRFYQKPEFVIAVCAAAAGIILITALFVITRRIAVNPYDMEEQPFFSEED